MWPSCRSDEEYSTPARAAVECFVACAINETWAIARLFTCTFTVPQRFNQQAQAASPSPHKSASNPWRRLAPSVAHSSAGPGYARPSAAKLRFLRALRVKTNPRPVPKDILSVPARVARKKCKAHRRRDRCRRLTLGKMLQPLNEQVRIATTLGDMDSEILDNWRWAIHGNMIWPKKMRVYRFGNCVFVFLDNRSQRISARHHGRHTARAIIN